MILTLAGLFACTAIAAASPSVVDQYTEQIPTAGGEVPSSSGGTDPAAQNPASAGDTTGGVATGPSSADTDSSPGTGSGSGDQPSSSAAEPGAGEEDSSTSAVGTAPTTGDDDGGMGILLPILIVLIAGAAVFLAFQRRRGSGPAPS